MATFLVLNGYELRCAVDETESMSEGPLDRRSSTEEEGLE